MPLSTCLVLAVALLVLASIPASPKDTEHMPSERQLTYGPLNKDLDNNVNFSPDGRFLVFDCRDEKGINGCSRLGKVDVRSGETTLFYTQKPPVLGVGAASFLNNSEVVAIHALTNGDPYDFTVRGGTIIAADGSGRTRWLDSRDVTPPFTPGALRGGTHKHEPDASGDWIGFTYNDHVMKFQHGSDLRNVGVSKRGIRVPVHPDATGRNFQGETFSVLLTASVEHPKPGSDEFQRAEGDCWVGKDGYRTSGGRRQRARAFRATVLVEDDGKPVPFSDLFIVDVPDDITVPGPLGPLQGTLNDYPKPPAGSVARRLTRTAGNADRSLRGVTGHIRASGDAKWLAFIGKARRGDRIESQLFVVSPVTGKTRQVSRVPGGVVGDPRCSADSQYIAVCGSDGAVYAFRITAAEWGKTTQLTLPSAVPATNLVISPDSRLVAYNRTIEGVKQIFSTPVPVNS
jgi:hypothetical protein